MTVSKALGSIVCCQAVITEAQASWLSSSRDVSGEQLSKDTEWHNIATCSCVHFASQASTFPLSLFSWQVDSCPGLSYCISVELRDLNGLWVCKSFRGYGCRGAIVAKWEFWATLGNNTPGLAWLSPGPWPSEVECGV